MRTVPACVHAWARVCACVLYAYVLCVCAGVRVYACACVRAHARVGARARVRSCVYLWTNLFYLHVLQLRVVEILSSGQRLLEERIRINLKD